MRRAFSLIELLVALSILAVVAAIIVPKFVGVRSEATAAVTADVQNELQNALDHWRDLGGTLGGSSGPIVIPGCAASAFLQLMTASPRPTNGIGVDLDTATDSSGVAGSATIGLSMTVNKCSSGVPFQTGSGSPAPAGYNTAGQFYYIDGSPNVWYVDGSGIAQQVTIDPSYTVKIGN
jgi:prepilin-type N-terminal cleavage/methylation domain-containing protein